MSTQYHVERLMHLSKLGFVSKNTAEYFTDFHKIGIENFEFSIFQYQLNEYPLISVIIPTYNRVNMLKRAITSVQSQTYPKLEVVVINDCSTDETFNYLESLKFTKGDLKIIHNEKNLNAGKNRQIGYQNCTGEYVVFLDDDDF
ncbi:MAG: glycosyltransferase [Erysipelothrix sp.]|nr:glycosyltransferase [Erysipelothrix sp.]